MSKRVFWIIKRTLLKISETLKNFFNGANEIWRTLWRSQTMVCRIWDLIFNMGFLFFIKVLLFGLLAFNKVLNNCCITWSQSMLLHEVYGKKNLYPYCSHRNTCHWEMFCASILKTHQSFVFQISIIACRYFSLHHVNMHVVVACMFCILLKGKKMISSFHQSHNFMKHPSNMKLKECMQASNSCWLTLDHWP